MSSPAIRTRELSRQFGTVRALDQLSIEIPRGIIFGFLGKSSSIEMQVPPVVSARPASRSAAALLPFPTASRMRS